MNEAKLAKATRFRPYPEYGESGFKDQARIPRHWTARPLKFALQVNSEILPEETPPNFAFRYVDISAVDSRGEEIATEELTFDKAPSRARRVVRSGDTIISTVRTYLKAIAYFPDVSEPIVASTGFAVLRPGKEWNPSFLRYAIQADYFLDSVVANSQGIGYPAIAPSQLASLPIITPSLGEQHAIASFLDRETMKIDALIAKKERLIELLNEKREILINRAVTAGFDRKVKMEPTGSTVFPEIPSRWKLRKFRRLIRQVKRPVTVDSDTEYREIGIRSWGKGIFHKDPVRGALLEEKSVFRVEPNDLVLNIVFAWEGAVAVVSRNEVGMVASHRFPTFRASQEVDLDWLLMLLQSEQGRALMGVNSPGAAGRNRTIRLGQFLDEEGPLPPLGEQREIVNAFRADEKRFEALRSKVGDAIDRLREYRTALISAAVTGKIDVRDQVAV